MGWRHCGGGMVGGGWGWLGHDRRRKTEDKNFILTGGDSAINKTYNIIEKHKS